MQEMASIAPAALTNQPRRAVGFHLLVVDRLIFLFVYKNLMTDTLTLHAGLGLLFRREGFPPLIF